MKLYTEEQVIKTLFTYPHHESTPEELLKELTPIELPSDEEIEKESSKWRAPSQAFRGGAKWMKEQILNKTNNIYGRSK
jgi:hypothetical protein